MDVFMNGLHVASFCRLQAFHMAGVVLVTLITQLSYTSCRSSTVTVTGGSESGHDPPRAQCGWVTWRRGGL